MNNEDLQQMTETLSKDYFSLPFKHQAYFNKRLRTTGGRYLLKSHNIEINYKQYEHFGKDAIVQVVLHELCHYHLHIQNKGYQHRDQDFKKLSKQVGAPRYCTPTENYEDRVNYMYQCLRCGTKAYRIRKVNIKKMVCGKCGGRLKEFNLK